MWTVGPRDATEQTRPAIDGQSIGETAAVGQKRGSCQTSSVVSTICRSLVMTCGRTAGKGGSDAGSRRPHGWISHACPLGEP